MFLELMPVAAGVDVNGPILDSLVAGDIAVLGEEITDVGNG